MAGLFGCLRGQSAANLHCVPASTRAEHGLEDPRLLQRGRGTCWAGCTTFSLVADRMSSALSVLKRRSAPRRVLPRRLPKRRVHPGGSRLQGMGAIHSRLWRVFKWLLYKGAAPGPASATGACVKARRHLLRSYLSCGAIYIAFYSYFFSIGQLRSVLYTSPQGHPKKVRL